MGELQGLSNITGIVYESWNKQTIINNHLNIRGNFILGPANSSDESDGVPWYSFGFKGNKPHISGYTGMIFRAGTGNVVMSEDGVMRGPGFIQSSDRRIKSNIRKLSSVLEKIKKLNPSSYTLKSDKKHHERIGLIAQEVETVFPQFVYTDEKGYKAIDYASMITICIKA